MLKKLHAQMYISGKFLTPRNGSCHMHSLMIFMLVFRNAFGDYDCK